MDKIDIQILEILQKDARISASDISKKVKLSVPSVSDRIRKLNNKIINSYTAILNHKEANLDVTAFIFIVSEHSDHYEDFIKIIKNSVDKVNQNVSVIENVRKFLLIDEEFTVENDMMTPTLKVRRFKVKEKYKEKLENLY